MAKPAEKYLRHVWKEVWSCTCARCGHKWLSMTLAPPSKCASCRLTKWWNEVPGKKGWPKGKPRKVYPPED